MKKAIRYFIPYLPWLVVMVAFVFGQAMVNLTLPDYTANIINDGIIKNNLNAIWRNGAIMLILTATGGACAVFVSFFAARISAGYVMKLRRAAFSQVEQFSLDEFDKFSSSSLITRSTNDMQQIQNVMSMIMRMTFMAPIMGIGSIIKAHQLAPHMSWIVLVAIVILAVLMTALFMIVVPKFKLIQQLVDRLSLQTKEMLTGVRVIRAYDNNKLQQDKFNTTNIESTKLNIFVNRVIMMIQPVMMLLMGLASMTVIWFGAYQVKSGDVQVGDLVAIMQYIIQTITSFLFIAVIFVLVPRAAVSVKRINEILASSATILDPKEPKSLPSEIDGVVEFHDVKFGYETSEQSILEHISFTANPGETTAIIGGTGSGKTSILKLIPRLYDVSDGQITIDGIDVRDITQIDLHSVIGYVPQKASLFSGTIKNNIRYGQPKATDKEIDKALKISQSAEFVDKLPKKLDSEVSQGGKNFSGGQKQRLSIARVLVKRPKIYLFDDSFSALDFETDAKLRQALSREIEKSTFIIVAQRVSTIMQADQIIVLDDGKIVGKGMHRELMKSCKVYQEIAKSQLAESELKGAF